MIDTSEDHPPKDNLVLPPKSFGRVSGIAMRDSRLKSIYFPPNTHVAKAASKPIFIPPDLGKSAERMENYAKYVGFFQACAEAHRTYKLKNIPIGLHPASGLLSHNKEY